MVNKFFSLEAESEVLGAIMVKNDVMLKAYDALRVEDFYNTRHQLIYDAMISLYKKAMNLEPIIIHNELGEKANEVGGLTYLCEISNGTATAANIDSYIKIIREKSINRKVQHLLSEGLHNLKNGDGNGKAVAEKLTKALLIDEKEETKGCNIEESLNIYLTHIQKIQEKGDGLIGLTTGKRTLDKVLGGFIPQDLIIIAGRPSMGKTAVALNLALGCSMKGKGKVGIFSLEMNQNQCTGRLLSMHSKVPMGSLSHGHLQDEQWEEVMKSSNILSILNLKIFDGALDLSSIINHCKKMKIQEGLDVVFIDYIQIIVDKSTNSNNRNNEIMAISRALKLLAKELNITVVILSQLARGAENRVNHRPIMSDLRDSGSLEQDADVVMGIYRDEYYHTDSEEKGKMEVIILKNRNGETGTLKFKWQGETQRIV